MGLVEVLWLLATAGASFDGARETSRFVGLTALVCGGAGALVGVLQGLLAAVVRESAAALGEPRRDAVWQARLYTALSVPPVALGCAQIFAGPRARTIAHHDLYAVGIGVTALVLFWLGLRGWQRLYDERLARGAAFAVAAGCALVSIGAYVADQKILVRLYPFFHVGLGALSFGAAELAIALGALGLRRRAVTLLRPSTAMAIGCLALAGGASALSAVGRDRALRTVLVERAALAGPLVRALHRAAPGWRAPLAADVVATPKLPEGPHLGAVDVVLITVDAMRADRLTARTAPALTALASQGVVFERAYAQVPHTSFSIATLLTGKYVYALSTLGLDTASHQTLAEIMKRERYKTAAFYPPSVFYIDRERLRAMEEAHYGFEYVKYEHLDAPARTDQVIHFLESERPARTFLWVHYFEPHEPYDRHPGHFDAARDAMERYDGEVHFVDGEVARLVAYLARTRPHALVIVAADHGEEFGEHGGRYHGTTLYDEQVHVPLAFVPLDGALTPHRVAAPVGLVDVAPTLLALIGIVPSAKMRGRDLGPWLLPPAAMAPVAAHGPVFGEINQQKMIIDGSHKLVCDLGGDACSAFDLAVDPGERKNRIDDPFAATLRRRLDGWMVEEARFESTGGAGETDPRIRRLLERARLGDKSVAVELAPLVDDPALRPEVVHLLGTLPPEPATRAALARVDATEPSRPWADLALARLGDAAARARLAPRLTSDCGQGGRGPADWCARAALAVDDVPALTRALEQQDLDEPLVIALVGALGRSHDPRALEPLMLALAPVRTRADTVTALAELDDARALPTLLRWLPAEPYVPVRARMVALVAQLGRHEPAAPRALLGQLAAVERELPVMAALVPALHALGAPAVVDLQRGPARAVAGGELWLIGKGDGTLELASAGASVRVAMTDGVAHLDTPRAGSFTVRRRNGDASARFAFSRPSP